LVITHTGDYRRIFYIHYGTCFGGKSTTKINLPIRTQMAIHLTDANKRGMVAGVRIMWEEDVWGG